MNIREILAKTIERLKRVSILTADLDAVIIVKTVLKQDDLFVITHPEQQLSEMEKEAIENLTSMREKLYPIGYIKNSKEFYGLEFYVDENVLIPRPETEMLVDKVIKLSGEFENPKIADIGTGSGCIAVALSKLLNINVIASDISYKALKIAKENAKRLGANVELVQADTLSFLKKRVDIIVSNPPYIDKNDFESLQRDVKYEPREALICSRGTEIIEKIIEQSKNLCRYLVLEIGYNQKNFIERFPHCIEVENDLSNLPRMAVFRFDF